MKITKIVGILLLAVSSVLNLQNTKSTAEGFYPGATEQQLLKTSTPLINMNDATSQLLNACLQAAFTTKYESQERELWSKLERVNNKPTELYQRAFWVDFFGNIREELKDSNGKPQICATALTASLKNQADFNDYKLQKQIRDSMVDYRQKVGNLVLDRQKTFITSSISTHRGSRLVSTDVFNKLNARTNNLR